MESHRKSSSSSSAAAVEAAGKPQDAPAPSSSSEQLVGERQDAAVGAGAGGNTHAAGAPGSTLRDSIDAEVLAEIKRQVALPSPWQDMDPDRKLQYLHIKALLKNKFGRSLRKIETTEVKNRLRPLSTSLSSLSNHNRSLLNMTVDTSGGALLHSGTTIASDESSANSSTSSMFSPLRRSREFTVTNRDTGERFSIDEVERYFPLDTYDTWSQAEEVDVILREGPTGVIFTAEWGALGVADDALEEHHPLRIKEFKRNIRNKSPMQLEATGLLAIGDMVVAINGKSVRGRPWAVTAKRLKESPRPVTITFEKRPRVSRQHNARTVRRKIVRVWHRIRNKELRARLRQAERRLRAALKEVSGLKILAGEMRFNGGSISLAKYTLIYNLQRAVIRAFVNEFGEEAVSDGPTPRRRNSRSARHAVRQRAVQADVAGRQERRDRAETAARGAEVPSPSAQWGAGSFVDSRAGYDGDMDDGSTVGSVSTIADETFEFTPTKQSATPARFGIGSAGGSGRGSQHKALETDLSDISEIGRPVEVDHGGESSEWSDGGDVLFGTDSEHEMSLTEREHI